RTRDARRHTGAGEDVVEQRGITMCIGPPPGQARDDPAQFILAVLLLQKSLLRRAPGEYLRIEVLAGAVELGDVIELIEVEIGPHPPTARKEERLLQRRRREPQQSQQHTRFRLPDGVRQRRPELQSFSGPDEAPAILSV